MYAVINASANGQNTIVAAVPGKHIRVTSYVFMSAGAVAAKFRSGTTDLSGAFPLVAQAGVAAPLAPPTQFAPRGYFETEYGEALVLNLDAAVLVAGHLTYELVP